MLGFEPVVKALKGWKGTATPTAQLMPAPAKWRLQSALGKDANH